MELAAKIAVPTRAAPRMPKRLVAYVTAVSVVGIGALLACLGIVDPFDVGVAPGRLWWLIALLILGEVFPVVVPHRGEMEAITTATVFAFALLLADGPSAALLGHTAASLIADLMQKKAWYKAVFNVGQYSLTLVATGAVYALLGGAGGSLGSPGVLDLGRIAACALTYFLCNNVLVGSVIALAQRLPVLAYLRQNFAFHAFTTGLLLALSPVVVVIAQYHAPLLPLLLLPMAAVYQSARVSVAKQHQALHDTLTDLPNRSLFTQRLEDGLAESARSATGLAVLLIDLDGFREVNDTLGHDTGDLLLRQVGGRLQDTVGPSGTIARLGGDEFAVLVPGVDDDATALEIAHQLGEALERPFPVGGMALAVEGSIGIALAPRHADAPALLMQRAEVALYLAKRAHSGAEVYAAARNPHNARTLSLLGELRRALAAGELVLHYQPKVEIVSGRVIGVEALLRWDHPVHGLLPPSEFVTAAEHTSLIRPLTTWVLDEALRQCAVWHDTGRPLTIAVNVSARNLHDVSFSALVRTALNRHRLAPRWLHLEVTEHAVMADPVRVAAQMRELSALGVGLALDDFGTGYSSLAHVVKLPVDELKIDRSFVAALPEASAAAVVAWTAQLARTLGLRTVAEGVEDAPTMARLRDLGCDAAQGYFISRPLPGPELDAWLAGRAVAA